MATLILYDHATHREIGRRDAKAEERYALYQLCTTHGLFGMHGMRYTVISVAYNPTTEQMVVQGTFDSYEPGVSDCE